MLWIVLSAVVLWNFLGQSYDVPTVILSILVVSDYGKHLFSRISGYLSNRSNHIEAISCHLMTGYGMIV